VAKAFGGLGVTVGLEADRTSMTGMVAGQQFFETGSDVLYVYTGSAWRMVASPTATNGGVLQVAQTVKTSAFSSAASGFQDITGLSVSLTPKSTSNKVLVFAVVSMTGQANVSVASVRLLRGSTVIYAGDAAGVRPLGFGQIFGGNSDGSQYSAPTVVGIYLDSPASVSAVTYKVQILAENASAGSVLVNRTITDRNGTLPYARTASSITLMEVAA